MAEEERRKMEAEKGTYRGEQWESEGGKEENGKGREGEGEIDISIIGRERKKQK